MRVEKKPQRHNLGSSVEKREEMPLYTVLSHKKKNKIMSFAATWMDVEIVILSGGSQRNTNII